MHQALRGRTLDPPSIPSFALLMSRRADLLWLRLYTRLCGSSAQPQTSYEVLVVRCARFRIEAPKIFVDECRERETAAETPRDSSRTHAMIHATHMLSRSPARRLFPSTWLPEISRKYVTHSMGERDDGPRRSLLCRESQQFVLNDSTEQSKN